MANYLFEVFVYRSLISLVLQCELHLVLHKTPEQCNFFIILSYIYISYSFYNIVLPTFVVVLLSFRVLTPLLTHRLLLPSIVSHDMQNPAGIMLITVVNQTSLNRFLSPIFFSSSLLRLRSSVLAGVIGLSLRHSQLGE